MLAMVIYLFFSGFSTSCVLVERGIDGLYVGLGTIYLLFIEQCSAEELATVNALGLMINSSMRSIGPVFATSLFAVTVDHKLLGGTLVYWVCFVGVVVATLVNELIPESPVNRGE